MRQAGIRDIATLAKLFSPESLAAPYIIKDRFPRYEHREVTVYLVKLIVED